MSRLDREWIALGFHEDEEKIIPVIRMSGIDGLKKLIRDVGGVSRILIYHLDFNTQTTRMAGSIPWPEGLDKGDVVISYNREERKGTVRIAGIDQIWSYDIGKENNNRDIVNRDRVRQLEENEQKKILWPDELADELKREIYGQDEAITKISELIAGNLRRKKPEVEVIVLFGPTGVGKTEVGRNLPAALTKLTGVQYGLQQIALNEFVGEHSINRFFGSPPSYVGYKDPTVFEPVRKNPYQVFLMDEIEKATDRIWTGLMEAFSTGIVHMADNSPDINLRHVIFIITSNIAIDMEAYNLSSAFRKKEICRDALSKVCGHPEIAGKITNCLAFQPLSKDALTDIVSKFVVEELYNYDMELDHMDEALMVQLKKQHSHYGARGVRDAVREALINATVYERNMEKYKGKRVRLKGDMENIQIEIVPEAKNTSCSPQNNFISGCVINSDIK